MESRDYDLRSLDGMCFVGENVCLCMKSEVLFKY